MLFAKAQPQQQIDSLMLAIQQADDTKQSELKFKISQLYANSNPAKSIDWAEQAFEKSNNKIERGKINQHLGSLYYRIGNMNKAIDCYRYALQISIESGNETNTAKAQTALGGAYFIIGNLGESLYNYLQALRFYEAQNDKTNMVNVLSGLSAIYAKQNNFSKALEYNLKATSIYEASSDKFKTLMSYDQVGN